MESKNWGLPTTSESSRFARYVKKKGTCLLWTSTINKHGYGEFFWRGKKWTTHRLSLIWKSEGLEKADLCCLHSCRNRNCVSVDHLRWGTVKDNCSDKLRDGTQTHGVDVVHSKLSGEIAQNIFRNYHQNNMSASRLAKIYDVSTATVLKIANRETWSRATETLKNISERERSKLGRLIRSRPLDRETVSKVWDLWHNQHFTQAKICQITGLSFGSVKCIISRKIYSDITENLPAPRERRRHVKINGSAPPKNKNKFSKETVATIWKSRHGGQIQQSELARIYNVDRQTIGDIEKGETWRSVTRALECPSGPGCRICMRWPVR